MQTKNRNIRKQFLLDEDTASTLKFLALTKATSENEIVNKALNAYFKRFKAVPASKELGEED
jgi:hypothetical protein